MSKKLVSIVVNCFNGEKYLKKNLESIQRQEYSNWELIFWDNQSSDNSKKIFDSFNDKRFKYFYSDKHTTLYEARNLACEKTHGDFIAFLDCDDWWYENFLSSRENFFNKEKYDFSYSNCHKYFEKSNRREIYTKNKLPSGKIYDFLSKKYLVNINTLVVRKSSLKKINFFNPEFNIIGDFDAVMKMCKYGEALAFQDPLACIRIHGKNFHDENRKMFFKEYKTWFIRQSKDNLFKRNRIFFLKRLLYLYFVSLFPKSIKDFFKKK